MTLVRTKMYLSNIAELCIVFYSYSAEW